MLKKLYLPILLSALIGSMTGCNSNSDGYDYEFEQSSSVLVSGFYLNNDSKVLDSLQNVFFSIDLENGKIYNADSLPYGTKVSSLIPNITAPSSASEVTLNFYCTKTKRDSTLNYLTNSTDSVDFSAGPVKLTVKSQGGLATKDYEIRVNVHKTKADSLAWYKLESGPIPTRFTKVKAQCTARKDETFYSLTTDGQTYAAACVQSPASDRWTIFDVDFGFTPKVESLRATDASFYILSDDDTLYTSDDFTTWTSTGLKWHYIYGEYEDEIFGSVISDEGNKIAFYPSGMTLPMPYDFPIEGTTLPATYTMPMGDSAQLVMLGGRRADGTLVTGAWSFDGTTWADVTNRPIGVALEYMTMVPYHLVQTSISSWKPQSYPVLLAFGGRDTKGAVNRTVYYSRDWGISWKKAPDLVQFPDAFPSIYGASAFERYSTMHVASVASAWTEIPVKPLPRGACFMPADASTRAIEPITEWECPEIYLFGGRDRDGETLNDLWRGVIYQFTFKPVQ